MLEIQVPKPGTIQIGNLDEIQFHGTYLYVGSAMGSGGFKRVERHCKLNRHGEGKCHWHIDYLLEAADLEKVWLIPTTEDLECKLAMKLNERLGDCVEGFGSSDCSCTSHLLRLGERKTDVIFQSIEDLGLDIQPFVFDPDWIV